MKAAIAQAAREEGEGEGERNLSIVATANAMEADDTMKALRCLVG